MCVCVCVCVCGDKKDDKNKCTEVQNPRYKCTPQHEQKLSLKSIIIEQCVDVLSSSARDQIST